MASAQPTFLESREELKKHLRLTHVKTGEATDVILDEALRKVRAGFIRVLGLAQLQTLQGYTFVEDPQTNEQALRFIAHNCELNWVRMEILELLATRTVDSAGDILHAWNYEGFIREMSAEERTEQLGRMQDEISRQLAHLELDVAIGEESSSSVSVIQPPASTPNPVPHESVFPWLGTAYNRSSLEG